jgi:AcrR family transcriptional regulator
MPNDNAKEQLLNATIELLAENCSADKITARQIAAKAEVNLAMINYYFPSKDALISVAVDKVIANQAAELEAIKEKDIPAKQKLLEFLLKMSDITVEFSQYTKSTIPYVLLEKEIEEPYHILPMVKECYGDKCSETECRIIAYQLTTFSQIAFYRSDDFKKYSGLDMMKSKDRKELFDTLMKTLIQI